MKVNTIQANPTKFIVTLIVACTVGNGAARAGAFEDALTLVRSGDVEMIERTFDAQYSEFVDDEISYSEFNSPYSAFYTLDPAVLEMIEEWRKAFPNSAYARVAEAGPKMHLAITLRGEGPIQSVPRTSYAKAVPLWTEAIQLYSDALDIAPQHIMAASGLRDAAQWLGNGDAALRANRVLAVYGSPYSLLMNQLNQSTPQWGGSEAMMRRLCDTVAPKIDNLTVAECQARATLMLWHQPRELRDQAVEVLRQEDEDGNRFIIAHHYLYSGRAEEALELYDEVDAWIPGKLAADFGLNLGRIEVQERIVDRWLAVNPLTPRHLALKSEAQGRRRDYKGATESIEKAMIYGETIPEVRRWRFASILADESRHSELFDDIEDALVDTDFDPVIMEFAIGRLVWDSRSFRYGSDGAEHPRYQCRLIRILSNAFNSCERHRSRRSTLGCTDESLKRIHEILGESDIESCRDLGPFLPLHR